MEFNESLYLKKMLPNNLYYMRNLRNMCDEAGLNWALVSELSKEFLYYEFKNACTFNMSGISRKFKELVKDCPMFNSAVKDHQHKFLETLLSLVKNTDSNYMSEIGALIFYLEESINKRHELRKKCTGLLDKKVQLNFKRNKYINNNPPNIKRQERMYLLNQMKITKNNHNLIQEVYKERDRINTMDNSNTMWEVDHIQPILGKDVSGLHVPWNLRVITRDENRKKSNHSVC